MAKKQIKTIKRYTTISIKENTYKRISDFRHKNKIKSMDKTVNIILNNVKSRLKK